MSAADDKDKRPSDHPTINGRRLVIATLIFGALVGSSAFVVRPLMRRARARQTFQSLIDKLAAGGIDLKAAPAIERPPPPRLPATAEAAAIAGLLQGQSERPARSLAEREEDDALLNQSLDLIEEALAEGRLSREQLIALAASVDALREGRAWKPFIARLIASGIARYDAITQGYDRDENALLALFHSAESTEMKVSYVRMTATAIEALEVPYKGGLIIARRADEVAAQQEKRLRDQDLRLFPAIEPLVEREFRLRARLRLLALAIAIAREPEKAPELAARSLDPITGAAFVIKDGGRLSRESGADDALSLRLPFTIPN